jgi:hypothetical protein
MAESDIPAHNSSSKTVFPFQSRVAPWMQECFGPVISADIVERNHRFLEEALELVQACGCSRNEALQLVDYVYARPVGESPQEVGGVLVTLAALCLAQGLNMHVVGEAELTRIRQPDIVKKIRLKQATKPKGSPLPQMHSEDLYYIQNKGYVGSSLLWWKKEEVATLAT